MKTKQKKLQETIKEFNKIYGKKPIKKIEDTGEKPLIHIFWKTNLLDKYCK